VRLLVGAFLVTMLAGCGDPISMLPGGALDGEVAPSPADWTSAANVETIQVEFRPEDPYSHNIWAVGIGDDLYIATGGDGTRWTPFIAADPRVRARIGSTLYELTAAAVTDPAERDRVATEYSKKYEIDPADNWVAAGLIYRLDRR
jgi:hypothetical protein